MKACQRQRASPRATCSPDSAKVSAALGPYQTSSRSTTGKGSHFGRGGQGAAGHHWPRLFAAEDRKNVLPCSFTRMKRIASRGSPAATGLMSRGARQNAQDGSHAQALLRFYADTQWGDPESYDVMLSSSHYGDGWMC